MAPSVTERADVVIPCKPCTLFEVSTYHVDACSTHADHIPENRLLAPLRLYGKSVFPSESGQADIGSILPRQAHTFVTLNKTELH